MQAHTCSSEHRSTLPNTFPGNNLLKVIIYSLSSKLSPPPFFNSLHSSWHKIRPRCVSDGRDVTFFLEQVSVPQTRSNCLAFAAWHTVGVFSNAECLQPCQLSTCSWTGYFRWIPQKAGIRPGSLLDGQTDRHADRRAGRQQEWECNIHQVIPPVTLYYLSSLNQLCHHPHSNRLSLEHSHKEAVRNI